MTPPSSSVHHHPPPHPPCSQLLRPLQLALVQVGVLGEQVVYGGQDDSDHPPTPNHVRVGRGGASVWGGALDMPSSWCGGSVGVGYLHLEQGRAGPLIQPGNLRWRGP